MTRPWQQIPCIRVAPDGTAVAEFRMPPDGVKLWQEFNERRRPDHALIIRGAVVSLGTHYKSAEEVAKAIEGFKPPRKEVA